MFLDSFRSILCDYSRRCFLNSSNVFILGISHRVFGKVCFLDSSVRCVFWIPPRILSGIHLILFRVSYRNFFREFTINCFPDSFRSSFWDCSKILEISFVFYSGTLFLQEFLSGFPHNSLRYFCVVSSLITNLKKAFVFQI